MINIFLLALTLLADTTSGCSAVRPQPGYLYTATVDAVPGQVIYANPTTRYRAGTAAGVVSLRDGFAVQAAGSVDLFSHADYTVFTCRQAQPAQLFLPLLLAAS